MPVTRNACFQTNLRVPLDFKFWHIKGVMKPSSTGFQMITYSDAQKNMFLALWSIFANLSVHRTVASPKPFWFSYFKNKDPCFALCLDVEVFLQELDYCKKHYFIHKGKICHFIMTIIFEYENIHIFGIFQHDFTLFSKFIWWKNYWNTEICDLILLEICF